MSWRLRPSPGTSFADFFETIGAAPDVDTYLVSCGASTTKHLHVLVCDDGDFDDTVFHVQITGRTPTGLLGKTLILDTPVGDCSEIAHLTRASPGPMSAMVTVTERNNAGAERYQLFLQCEDKNLTPVGNITVTKKQDDE